MWIVDGAALVVSIDQVEDLRFFDDYHERFQKAARDLIQIANRVPTSVVLLSCLGDFYGKVREVLAQSYIDRIEKAGPVSLKEARTAEEAQLIIAKRMQADASRSDIDPLLFFGPQFFEEFSGLSTRVVFWSSRKRGCASRWPKPTLRLRKQRAALSPRWRPPPGFGGRHEAEGADASALVEFHEHWDRFTAQSRRRSHPMTTSC